MDLELDAVIAVLAVSFVVNYSCFLKFAGVEVEHNFRCFYFCLPTFVISKREVEEGMEVI